MPETDTNRRAPVVGVLLICALYFSGVAISYRLFTSEVRRALPWSASQVQDYQFATFAESECYLRARLPESEFPSYAKRLGLRLEAEPMNPQQDLAGRFPPDWWNPPPSSSMGASGATEYEVTIAVCEHGYLYVYVTDFY